MNKRALLLFATTALLGVGTVPAQTTPPIAKDIIAKIVAANGAAPVPNTVDTIKAGDPNTPVTGIATTFMDSMAMLREAVAHGDNLVITHEPTFYNHPDDMTVLPNDPVVAEKLRYIQDHHLVVWRFHDGWHRHVPDGILTGMVEELGLKDMQVGGTNSHHFTFPQPMSVLALATLLEKRTGATAVRVVGDPQMPVTHMTLLPGAAGLNRQVEAIEDPGTEVEVIGEATEWEAIPYVRDAQAQGRRKALILLGHNASEEAGMQYCAEWLKGVLPGLRIDYLPAGEAFSAVVTRGSAP